MSQPLEPSTSGAVLARAATAPATVRTQSRVLVVDDDEDIRQLQTTYLRRVGYDVSSVGDGASALRFLVDEKVDLVITDIVMPDSDGVELIRNLRREYPDLRIIAMSGGGAMSSHLLLHIARSLGVSRTLAKPFGLDALLHAVRAALDPRHR